MELDPLTTPQAEALAARLEYTTFDGGCYTGEQDRPPYLASRPHNRIGISVAELFPKPSYDELVGQGHVAKREWFGGRFAESHRAILEEALAFLEAVPSQSVAIQAWSGDSRECAEGLSAFYDSLDHIVECAGFVLEPLLHETARSDDVHPEARELVNAADEEERIPLDEYLDLYYRGNVERDVWKSGVKALWESFWRGADSFGSMYERFVTYLYTPIEVARAQLPEALSLARSLEGQLKDARMRAVRKDALDEMIGAAQTERLSAMESVSRPARNSHKPKSKRLPAQRWKRLAVEVLLENVGGTNRARTVGDTPIWMIIKQTELFRQMAMQDGTVKENGSAPKKALKRLSESEGWSWPGQDMKGWFELATEWSKGI